MKRLYFGTDGVRGPYGSAVMNEDFAWRLGAAAGRWLKAEKGISAGHVLIGRDTRASGPALAQAVADGLVHEGHFVSSLEVLPTPAVALAVRLNQAALGVVITASHNPATDNGIKFFGAGGIKLIDAEEVRIEQLMPGARLSSQSAAIPRKDGLSDYVTPAEKLLSAGLAGWKIVLDTANGATVATSAAVLRHYGADLLQIGAEPDGQNINAGLGSEHPEQMCAVVRQHGARLGIAHDGDGDRCVLCDEKGDVLDGDELLTILALHALKQGKLTKQTLIVTVQSNLGVDAAVSAAGGRVCRTSVGDRYVIERMLAEGVTLGGESSGHVICANVTPTGDGLLAALGAIEVMLATGQPLSVLRRQLVKFPQHTAALQVREKKPLASLPTLSATIRMVEARLGTKGRVLVRYSGTESKLRLLVEGPTDDMVAADLANLVAAARTDLEVL